MKSYIVTYRTMDDKDSKKSITVDAYAELHAVMVARAQVKKEAKESGNALDEMHYIVSIKAA